MEGFDTQASATKVKEEIVVLTGSPPSSIKHKRALSPSPQSNKRICTTQETRPSLPTPTDYGATHPPNVLHQGPRLVWAENRQSLCDALPYYKAHQSGAHTKNHIPIGVLLAGGVEPGDALHINKVITNLGGGRELKDGQWVRTNPEKAATALQGWITAKEQQLPVMVLIGHKHPNFAELDLSSIPGTPGFVVLDAFFVTEIWQEMVQPNHSQKAPRPTKSSRKQGSKAKKSKAKHSQKQERAEYPVFKVMLQRINTNERPSYWKGDKDTAYIPNIQPYFPHYECTTCGQTSPMIFDNQASLCLNNDCEQFFCVDGKKLSRSGEELSYSASLLNWEKPFTGDRSMIPATVPPPPANSEYGHGTELRCRAGMVCPHCYHCDSRVYYTYWQCGICGYTVKAEPSPYPVAEIKEEACNQTNKLHKNSAAFREDNITINMNENFVQKFQFENERSVRTIYMIFDSESKFGGSVVHERPKAALRQAPGGADELLREIQEPGVAMHLKRNAARCKGSAVQKLCRHFQQNCGFRYDFGVKIPDTSFEESPDVILKSLTHLTHMGKQAVEVSQAIFIDQAYIEVAGSTIMDGWKQPNELLALAYMEKDMIDYHDDGEKQLNGVISTLSLGSPAIMKLRIRTPKKTDKQNPAILDFQLLHGDVVTMCDTRLQAITEHTIVPDGIRRFAMTSRVIKPEYYLQKGPAKKLKESGGSLKYLEELAQIPARAAGFAFEGTRLQIDDAPPSALEQ